MPLSKRLTAGLGEPKYKHLKKSDFVINPLTGCFIKIGSKKYLQLVKDNYLQLNFKTRTHSLVYEGEHAADVLPNVPLEEHSMLWIKDNKIFKQRRKMTVAEHIDNTACKASMLIKNHLDEFNDNMTDEQIDKKVKQIIYQELIGQPPKK